MSDYMITYDREKYDNGELDAKAIQKLIKAHEANILDQVQKCKQYYMGEHAINSESGDSTKAQTVCNHAKDIADTAAGYFLGNPLSYRAKDGGDVQELTDTLMLADIDSVDQENALMLAITGRCFEYWHAAEGEAELACESLDPEYCFVVYDNTIVHNELFGVYYYYKKDDATDQADPKLYVLIATESEIINYVLNGETVVSEEREPHRMGAVPLLEGHNNKFSIGDFEQQIGLIDAYNTMTSDRVNDKEQFIDSILVLYGSILGDTEEETEEALDALKNKKLLELDVDSRAEYLTRTLDEGGMEVLRNALKEDIYTFSHVPNLTDKNFAGNSSGVAMEYKLLGLEMLTKTKERWYRRLLHKRLHIVQNFMGIKNKTIDPHNIQVTFTRGLPKNLQELAQIIATLDSTVSRKTLLSLLPFVEDPDAEMEAVQEQAERSIELQQRAFAGTGNTPDGLNEEEEDEE